MGTGIAGDITHPSLLLPQLDQLRLHHFYHLVEILAEHSLGTRSTDSQLLSDARMQFQEGLRHMKHIGPWDDRAISTDAFFGGVNDHQGLQYGRAIPSTKVIVQLVEELFVAIRVSVRQRLHGLQLHLLAELLV
jgi:hypothetical protein